MDMNSQIGQSPEVTVDIESLTSRETGLILKQIKIATELNEIRRKKWEQEKVAGISIFKVPENRVLFVKETHFQDLNRVYEIIQSKGYSIRDAARDALQIIDATTKKEDDNSLVMLADISVEELGFQEEQVHYGTIRKRAISSTVKIRNQEYVIESCQPKDAIAFATNYNNISNEEYWFRIASETIEIPQGYGVIFRIVRGKNEVKYFDTEANGDEDDYLDDHTHLIFRLKKK